MLHIWPWTEHWGIRLVSLLAGHANICRRSAMISWPNREVHHLMVLHLVCHLHIWTVYTNKSPGAVEGFSGITPEDFWAAKVKLSSLRPLRLPGPRMRRKKKCQWTDHRRSAGSMIPVREIWLNRIHEERKVLSLVSVSGIIHPFVATAAGGNLCRDIMTIVKFTGC